jgi:adenylate cyclase class 2
MIEVEIKLALGSLDEVRQRLRAAGAEPAGERQFEDNRLYDDQAGSVRATGRMLRLRIVGGRQLLTFKEAPTAAQSESAYKQREELETDVSDIEVLHAVLLRLGYSVRWRYQKWRESWRWGDLHVELDETPIGNFLELEGDPAAIDRAAERLGFTRSDYIAASYRDLQERVAGAGAGDLVFRSS